jgi:hypothetical protein
MSAYDPIITGTFSLLMGVVAYFLRRVHMQVDENGRAVVQFKAEVDRRFAQVEQKIEDTAKETRKELIEMFGTQCHERQDSCGKLRDAKLEKVENKCRTQCEQIRRMEEDRNKKWDRQESVNDQFRAVLHGSK